MNIPKDPHILLSFINTKLRDHYPNLEELCADYEIDATQLKEVIASIDYIYIREKNRFAPKL